MDTKAMSKMIAEALEMTTGEVTHLAKEIGVTRATLYAWRAGIRNPSRKNLRRLADALERRGDAIGELVERFRNLD